MIAPNIIIFLLLLLVSSFVVVLDFLSVACLKRSQYGEESRYRRRDRAYLLAARKIKNDEGDENGGNRLEAAVTGEPVAAANFDSSLVHFGPLVKAPAFSVYLSALRFGARGEVAGGRLASGTDEEAGKLCRIASTELSASTRPKPSGWL